MHTTFLELLEHVGIEPDARHTEGGLIVPNERAGEPGPFVAQGISIGVPVQIAGDIVTQSNSVRIIARPQACDPDWRGGALEDGTNALLCARIVPGRRVIETTAPPVVEALLETGLYRRIDGLATHSERDISKAKLVEQAQALDLPTKGLTKAQIVEAIAVAEAGTSTPETTTTETASTDEQRPAEGTQEG